MDQALLKVIAALREGRQQYAEAAMEYPKPEPFEHGVQVGVHRGLGMALSTIDNILKDAEEQDN